MAIVKCNGGGGDCCCCCCWDLLLLSWLLSTREGANGGGYVGESGIK